MNKDLSPTRIGLFLNASPTDGGAFTFSKWVLRLFLSLPSERYDKVVYYRDPVWEDYFASASGSVPYHKIERDLLWRLFDGIWRRLLLPAKPWRDSVSPFSRVYQRLSSERCALWFFPDQVSLAYQWPLPTIAPIFDLMHRYESDFPEVGSWGRGIRRDAHYQSLCDHALGIIVDSEMGKAHVLESYHVDEGKLRILPLMPGDHFFTRPASTRKKHNLPQKFLLYPAQFWTHKNHSRLIKATSLLLESLPEFRLVFVGSPKNGYLDAVKLCRQLGLGNVISFLGYIPDDDLVEIYRCARGLVYASLFGPTNTPPLEAFVMDCPVACSNAYGMPEQLGEAALFFDPSSTEAIADAMRQLWTDDELCADLIRKGNVQAKHWGPQQFTLRFQDIIESFIKEEPRDHSF